MECSRSPLKHINLTKRRLGLSSADNIEVKLSPKDPETVQFISSDEYPSFKYTATFIRRLLTRLSPYFKVLFKGGFSESNKDLLSIDCRAVYLCNLEQWILTRDSNLSLRSDYQTIGFYLFADYYDIPALRRMIMSKLVTKPFKLFPFEVFALAVELPSSSPLYRFLVDTFAHHEQFSELHYELLTKEFLYLMYRGVINKSGEKPCRCCHNPCDYHEHDDEEEWENSESCLPCRLPRPRLILPNSMLPYRPGHPKTRPFYVSQEAQRTVWNLEEISGIWILLERVHTMEGKLGQMESDLAPTLQERTSQ